MKKKYLFFTITVVILIFLFFKFNSFFTNNETTSNYYAQAIEVDGGYGYEVRKKISSKIYIKQEYIPSLNKKLVFCTKEDALKIGELVVDKLNNHINPAVSKEELKEQQIALTCK
ncbi:protein of unknown function [Mesonia phycicola]|uniref:DUF4907 domain-containing protein n=1 Tax=Mesonia phycicola TaxID=579105 RepID=A0A1M6C133_9FLAO|nr:DUF4907 domain-containing protein [Mesonia phycicola]SHI54408.1 protein of unknown function [Mesonia phycicola]